jgi:MscS family membrane protein
MIVRAFLQILLFVLLPLIGLAAETASSAANAEAANTTAVGAAAATGKIPRTPDFLEHLVDESLKIFDLKSGENTWVHFAVAAVFLIAGLLLRRVVTGIIFACLRKLAARTRTTLDDKLFPALEAPTATFIMLVGIFCALKVLKLSVSTDLAVSTGSRLAFSLAIFWALLRAFNGLLDHAQEIAIDKKLGVATFMPWIKKTLVVVFVTIGTLMVIQNLGYGESVKTVLAGLGIGGLAFALAAQDTIANLFGSIVVAIDQPFRLGETIKIAGNVGLVEDIGLRSTKLRLVDKSLMVIPNKTVAAESITNLARFTQRRVEQVLGLTYDTTAEQMEELVGEIRRLLFAEQEIDPTSPIVYFRDFNASSLDIWIVFVVKDPDFHKHMQLRQRLNLAFIRAVEARGLSFAFPTQTLHVAALPDSKA